MKLYIDDLRKCPEGWQLARTITEAIRILATQEVSEVSIDHDISHAVAVDNNKRSIARPFPCAETFEPVAWFLRAQAIAAVNDSTARLPKITLHTANPIGAKKMEEILESAGLESTTSLSLPVNGLE